MATNLRLRPAMEAALREESERTGCSQQEIIRQALEQFLGESKPPAARGSIADLLARGVLKPATPYRRPHRLLKLPEGVTSLDLLDREDRF
ncbi:MAG: ribbon-helix-helix protein, CopG family [Rhodoglobus sp.]